MVAKTLMVLGSSSSVGKSLLVTALCRIFSRRGWAVAPFKAQNMSNNAAVCSGGEIGRAQAVQALAAGIEPSVQMNPILLKPEADQRSQVIVLGKRFQTLTAREYYPQKEFLWQVITSSLDELRRQYELVIMEGAGSPVELNLKSGDIVNLSVAAYAQSPVILMGDIDRGGIFAQLLGSLDLMEPEERKLVKGLVVNKFRGDLGLFRDGIEILEKRSHLPVLGVIPYLYDHRIAAEDAVSLDRERDHNIEDGEIDIAVIHLPHISNFDDFDALSLEAGVRVRYISYPAEIKHTQAIILPGSKSTISDLAWLNQTGLAAAIGANHRKGIPVVGICGGYQMMGESIADPDHVESEQENVRGLGLLPVRTVFSLDKSTVRCQARVTASFGFWSALKHSIVEGYEIHSGNTTSEIPIFEIMEREGRSANLPDGCASQDGRTFGCYLHGLFNNDHLRKAWLSSLGYSRNSELEYHQRQADAIQSVADQVEVALDISTLDSIIFS